MLSPKSRPDKTARFSDGLLQLVSVSKNRVTGNIGHPLPFGNRTVGYGRYYAAAQAGVEISRTVTVPFDQDIRRGYTLELRSFATGEVEVHTVEQVQEQPDWAPPCKLVTLKEVKVTYLDDRHETERLGSL